MPRIQMYTTRWCGYCVRAKTLLDSRGIAYEEISLDDDPAFRQTVYDMNGTWTATAALLSSPRPEPVAPAGTSGRTRYHGPRRGTSQSAYRSDRTAHLRVRRP